MSEYLRNLPENATIEGVFLDLYGQTTELIEEINARRLAGYGDKESDQKPVPGTELLMNWAWAKANKEGGYSTTILLANVAGRNHRLLSATRYRRDDDSVPEPARVNANRNDELGGDFSLSQETSDESEARAVTVSLQGMGIEGPVVEPTGYVSRPPETPVDVLLTRDGIETAQRLEIVTQGILDNMTMVEMIRDGTPARDAFEMMGRPTAEVAHQ